MTEPQESDDLTSGIVPPLVPPPVPGRAFSPKPWHRPRKQYIRNHQWNREVIESIIKRRPSATTESVIRILGLPSSEYLDLLSMRDLCAAHQQQIQYLGFNVGHRSVLGTAAPSSGPIDLQRELQSLRIFGASSFVHHTSRVVPDLFEQIRIDNSMARNALGKFSDFDVLNLDLCGCIVDNDPSNADDLLDAISHILRWQSTQRLRPWLFFLTTFASATEINRKACLTLVDAIDANAVESEDFRKELQDRMGIGTDEIRRLFSEDDATLPSQRAFLEIFALAVGKWLSARLQLPSPRSLVSMLPSYYFRHDGCDEPHILSLGYFVEPMPVPGDGGIGITAQNIQRNDARVAYLRKAKKIIEKSQSILDLDLVMDREHELRDQMAQETQDLLTGSGFNSDEVARYLAPFRSQ